MGAGGVALDELVRRVVVDSFRAFGGVQEDRGEQFGDEREHRVEAFVQRADTERQRPHDRGCVRVCGLKESFEGVVGEVVAITPSAVIPPMPVRPPVALYVAYTTHGCDSPHRRVCAQAPG